MNILLLDDNKELVKSLKKGLIKKGLEVEAFIDPEIALKRLTEKTFDAIVSDIRMQKLDGIAFVEKAKPLQPNASFIMMTAYESTESAIKAFKLGVIDYLIKPFSIDKLFNLIIEDKKKIIKNEIHSDEIIGSSTIMNDVKNLALKVANENTTVTLLGESGTGKELFARFIHKNSKRAEKPFIPVNLNAIPETLIEAELFGVGKGAATGVEKRSGKFQLADGGTLFLDEIGDIPLYLQVKLLRAIQEKTIEIVGGSTKKIDIRIISATNRDLKKLVNDGKFREDLFYRIYVFPIKIPPLRERKEDIIEIFTHYIKKNKDIDIIIESKVIELLKNYAWPGNVRELENCAEYSFVLSNKKKIVLDDLPISIREGMNFSGIENKSPTSLQDMEIKAIINALNTTRGNKSRAARLLGITRRTLIYRIEKYKL
jgi:DNA-binding NtrC family response regulator